MVNASTNYFQISPAIATLTNGNVIVVWASFNEAGSSSMQDVYGRIFSPAGAPVTGEFLINQFTSLQSNARADGGGAGQRRICGRLGVRTGAYVPRQHASAPVALTRQSTVAYPSVDIYARLYNSSGSAQGNEFLVNTDLNPCANPAVAAGSDGGFVVTWDARDMTSPFGNGLDIYARSFSSAGIGGTVMRVNSYLYGDQYAPRISFVGNGLFDCVDEPGAGRFAGRGLWTICARQRFDRRQPSSGSTPRRPTQQIQPVVASDGVSQFLAVWSSFTGLPYSFDLFAQRYINTQQPLEPLPAPFVYAPFVVSATASISRNCGVVAAGDRAFRFQLRNLCGWCNQARW